MKHTLSYYMIICLMSLIASIVPADCHSRNSAAESESGQNDEKAVDDIQLRIDSICLECSRWDDFGPTDSGILKWAPHSLSAIRADSLCRQWSAQNRYAFLYRVNDFKTIAWTICSDSIFNFHHIKAVNFYFGVPLESFSFKYLFDTGWLNPDKSDLFKSSGNLYRVLPDGQTTTPINSRLTCGPYACFFKDGEWAGELCSDIAGFIDQMPSDYPFDMNVIRDMLYYSTILKWAGWQNNHFAEWGCIESLRHRSIKLVELIGLLRDSQNHQE